MTNRSGFKKAAGFLGGVVLIALVLYSWLVFRPTGIGELEQEAEQIIAREPKPGTVYTPIRLAKTNVPASTQPSRKYRLYEALARLNQTLLQEYDYNSSQALVSVMNGWSLQSGSTLRNHEWDSQPILRNEILDAGTGEVDPAKLIDLYNRGVVGGWFSIEGLYPPEWLTTSPEENNNILDAIESALYTNDILATEFDAWPMNAFFFYTFYEVAHLPILRAHYRGEHEKVEAYFARYIDFILEINRGTLGDLQDFGLDPPMAFTLLLNDLDALDSAMIETAIGKLENALLSAEECENLRTLGIARHGYRLKRLNGILPDTDAWHYFMDGWPERTVASIARPAYENRVDSYLAALREGEPRQIAEAREAVVDYLKVMNLDVRRSDIIFEQPESLLITTEINNRINREIEFFVYILKSIREYRETGEWSVAITKATLSADIYTVMEVPAIDKYPHFWGPQEDGQAKRLKEAEEQFHLKHDRFPYTPEELDPYLDQEEDRRFFRAQWYQLAARSVFVRILPSGHFRTPDGQPIRINPDGVMTEEAEELLRRSEPVLEYRMIFSMAPEYESFLEYIEQISREGE